MWPLICAAKPIIPPSLQWNVTNDVKMTNVNDNAKVEMATLTKSDRPSDFQQFFNVLNANSEHVKESRQNFIKHKKSTKYVVINEKEINSANPSMLLRKPQHTNLSNHVTVDTIRAMFMNNKNNHNPNEHSNKIETKPNDTRQFQQQEQMFHQNPTTIDVKNKFRSEKPLSELNLEQTVSNEWSHNLQNKTVKITFENVETTNNGTSDLCNDQKNNTQPINATVFATNDKNIYKINENNKNYHFDNETLQTNVNENDGGSSSLPTSSTSPTTQSVFLDYLNNFNETHLISFKSNAEKNELLSRTERSIDTDNNHLLNKTKKFVRNGDKSTNVERIERSANLSITRPTKRIQILIKSRLLQLLPDGTVNGTQNDESDYSK